MRFLMLRRVLLSASVVLGMVGAVNAATLQHSFSFSGVDGVITFGQDTNGFSGTLGALSTSVTSAPEPLAIGSFPKPNLNFFYFNSGVISSADFVADVIRSSGTGDVGFRLNFIFGLGILDASQSVSTSETRWTGTTTFTPLPETAIIPLPATLPLLLAGMGGLALLRLRAGA